ncbi:MAG: hypothetical protein GX442_10575 [Candidatus Riflebacteria bacterium]|nr:hypothetical protein [Candidatus Riflebacteria bacterium]
MSAYFELRALGYFFLHLLHLVWQSGAVTAFAWLAATLLAGVVFAFVLLLLMPRIVEDYVKVYNWYINSDFYVIFEEKVDVRLVFKLLALPFMLVLALGFSVVNMVVRAAYHLAAKLNLIRCVNCHATIDWDEGTVLCHVCGSEVTGTATKTCPGCHFKANTVRCPYCGYVVFVELLGQHPSAKAGKKA